MDELEQLRKQVDKVDDQILNALNERVTNMQRYWRGQEKERHARKGYVKRE